MTWMSSAERMPSRRGIACVASASVLFTQSSAPVARMKCRSLSGSKSKTLSETGCGTCASPCSTACADAAAAALPKNRVQLRHGGAAGTHQVFQNVAGTDARELMNVADEHEMRGRRHGAKKRGGELRVQHRSLVDDDEIRRERIFFVMRKPARRRIRLQNAVNGSRGNARGLAHALGGAPRRSGERHAHVFRAQNRAQRAQNRGFSRAGTAGDDRKFFGQRGLHRRGLFRREREPRLALRPGDGVFDADGRQSVRRSREGGNACGDFALRGGEIFFLQKRNELAGNAPVRAARKLHAFRADEPPVLKHFSNERAGNAGIDAEQLRGLFFQIALRERGVPVRLGELHRVGDAGLGALLALSRQAEIGGDFVRRRERDAVDVLREPIRIFLQHLFRVRAVSLDDAQTLRRRHAVGLQKNHDFAQRELLVPRVFDGARALFPDAGNFAQTRRFMGNDAQRVRAEAVDDASGVSFPDAAHKPAAEKFSDAVDARREPRRERGNPKLPPVRGMTRPRAAQLQRFAALHGRQRAGDDDFFPRRIVENFADREKILVVEKNDALEHADERVLFRCGNVFSRERHKGRKAGKRVPAEISARRRSRGGVPAPGGVAQRQSELQRGRHFFVAERPRRPAVVERRRLEEKPVRSREDVRRQMPEREPTPAGKVNEKRDQRTVHRRGEIGARVFPGKAQPRAAEQPRRASFARASRG
mgnify:CR=1 FL=1